MNLVTYTMNTIIIASRKLDSFLGSMQHTCIHTHTHTHTIQEYILKQNLVELSLSLGELTHHKYL